MPKAVPEFEVDYTPLFVVPYAKLPEDLMIWERRESWLLDWETRSAIQKLGGTLVAKSLDKDVSRAATIWRLSLNPAPVVDKVTCHLLQQGCEAKKVLKLIKDIKKVALEGKDQDFLKSYNVRQALLHWADENEERKITEADLLLAILKKVSKFLEGAFFPSFLEERRNLVFSFTPELCRLGHEKVEQIIAEIESWVQKVNQKQAEKKEELFQMSQRLKKEMSLILYFRPILVRFISEGFVSKAVEVVRLVPESEREMLRRRFDDLTVAVFKFIFDRQKNDGMFFEIDLD